MLPFRNIVQLSFCFRQNSTSQASSFLHRKRQYNTRRDHTSCQPSRHHTRTRPHVSSSQETSNLYIYVPHAYTIQHNTASSAPANKAYAYSVCSRHNARLAKLYGSKNLSLKLLRNVKGIEREIQKILKTRIIIVMQAFQIIAVTSYYSYSCLSQEYSTHCVFLLCLAKRSDTYQLA